MTQEELQKKHDRLVDKVRRMRGMQKEWFKYRVGDDLKRAKVLEREVDQLIDEEVKLKKSNQPEIFRQ